MAITRPGSASVPTILRRLDTRLLRGRTITEQDTPTSTRVAVVNEQFAKKFFKDQDLIGKHFGANDSKHTADFEIVGVVEDAKYQDPHGGARPRISCPICKMCCTKSLPSCLAQTKSQRIQSIQLHVAGRPENLESTVRRELAELDPDLTVIRMTSFGEQVSEAFNQERLLARLTKPVRLAGADPCLGGLIWSHGLHRGAAPGRSASV